MLVEERNQKIGALMVFDDWILHKLMKINTPSNMHMKIFFVSYLTIDSKGHSTFITRQLRIICNFVVKNMKILH